MLRITPRTSFSFYHPSLGTHHSPLASTNPLKNGEVWTVPGLGCAGAEGGGEAVGDNEVLLRDTE